MMTIERKPRKIVAPDGYIYHKDGEFLKAIYPLPSQDISDYELVTIEEYESILSEQEPKEIEECIM